MTTIKTLLAAGATLSLLSLPAMAATNNNSRTLILAQDATSTDAVATAEAAVEAARAELRAAIAAAQGVDEARQKLREALQAFEAARIAAGLPPTTNPLDLEPLLPEESAPPAAVEPPPAETPAPPPEEPPPPPPPADETPPPTVEEPPPPPPAETPPAVVEPLPPPPAEATPPPVVEEPVAPIVEPTPPPAEEPPPVPADQVAPPSPEQQPPAVEPPAAPPPVIEFPAPVVEEPPPPPPPAATDGAFDLQKFKARPKFGQAPAAEATPSPALPKTEEAVKEGAVLSAPDGRIIVKEGGQVTILHDDSSRFRQRGDRVQTDHTENETETTTVVRPDGTEIVTVRDQGGNIIQRYRKNKNGSIEVLIGEVEQPGVVGRIFGRGPQPGRPGPRRQAQLRLNLGPLQVTIPERQYIVESSRASEQQLQEALMAPPVEQVERTYSLEEIRRNGRLRDKVRRIDFDTITFDTGQATIPDGQIPQLQNIGQALRDLIERDPTQVILVEGHTDAVGSDLSNLALSDRRAETVAEMLSYYFGVPPENLITQGYGEQFLKIPTIAAERQNRRVAFRNITYLLRTSQAQ